MAFVKQQGVGMKSFSTAIIPRKIHYEAVWKDVKLATWPTSDGRDAQLHDLAIFHIIYFQKNEWIKLNWFIAQLYFKVTNYLKLFRQSGLSAPVLTNSLVPCAYNIVLELQIK